MNRDFILSKKKKVTRQVSTELHKLFDSGINCWDANYTYPYWDCYWYRKITYLFDDGKNFIWTNHPKDYANLTLLGIFAFKHINHQSWCGKL